MPHNYTVSQILNLNSFFSQMDNEDSNWEWFKLPQSGAG